MRKLKLQMQVTLDGMVARNDGAMDWMVWDWDDELKNYVSELTQPVDLIILGRKLAEGFIPHWQQVANDRSNPEVEAGKKFTDTQKIVFSKTFNQSPWDRTRVVSGDLKKEIEEIKSQPGGDIIVYGGATMVSSLIRENLIDEYHLFVNPAAIGNGLRIFDDVNGIMPLKFINAKSFPCGIVVLKYVN
jgi:dihydrofolate reductase